MHLCVLTSLFDVMCDFKSGKQWYGFKNLYFADKCYIFMNVKVRCRQI